MMLKITLDLVLFAFVVGFFVGLGWALAHWLVGKATVRL